MRLFGKRTPQAPQTPAAAPAAGDTEALRRQVAELQLANQTAATAKEAAERNAAAANMARDSALLGSTLAAHGTRLKVLNVDHFNRLVGDQFAVKDGKVVLKSDPAGDVAKFLDTFAAGDGKYLVAPTVPAGAGASGFPGGTQAPARPVLTTSEGATEFVRGLGRIDTPQTAPAVPGIVPPAT